LLEIIKKECEEKQLEKYYKLTKDFPFQYLESHIVHMIYNSSNKNITQKREKILSNLEDFLDSYTKTKPKQYSKSTHELLPQKKLVAGKLVYTRTNYNNSNSYNYNYDNYDNYDINKKLDEMLLDVWYMIEYTKNNNSDSNLNYSSERRFRLPL
jgi:hypothetical protein